MTRTTPKFKVGDKIRRISHDTYGIKVGDICTVKEINLFSLYYGILIYESKEVFSDHNFELVSLELNLETLDPKYKELFK